MLETLKNVPNWNCSNFEVSSGPCRKTDLGLSESNDDYRAMDLVSKFGFEICFLEMVLFEGYLEEAK